MQNLSGMKKSELYGLAKGLGVPGRSRMSKRDLAAAIEDAFRRRAQSAPAKQSPPAAHEQPAHGSSPMAAPEAAPMREERSRPDTYVDVGPALPDRYGRDILVAMVRDPNCIHCYWELQGGALDALGQRHGGDVLAAGQWILRTYNVVSGDCRDTEITVESRRWYLDVADDCAFHVEIGLRLPDDRFLVVARSNTVTTPSRAISQSADEQWMIVEDAFRKLMALSHASCTPSSPGDRARRFQSRSWGRSGLPLSST